MLLSWSPMEEELISQHRATAGCFYCMHKPPTLVLTLALRGYSIADSYLRGNARTAVSIPVLRRGEFFLIHAMDDTA